MGKAEFLTFVARITQVVFLIRKQEGIISLWMCPGWCCINSHTPHFWLLVKKLEQASFLLMFRGRGFPSFWFTSFREIKSGQEHWVSKLYSCFIGLLVASLKRGVGDHVALWLVFSISMGLCLKSPLLCCTFPSGLNGLNISTWLIICYFIWSLSIVGTPMRVIWTVVKSWFPGGNRRSCLKPTCSFITTLFREWGILSSFSLILWHTYCLFYEREVTLEHKISPSFAMGHWPELANFPWWVCIIDFLPFFAASLFRKW